jgi:hypothetical protein
VLPIAPPEVAENAKEEFFPVGSSDRLIMLAGEGTIESRA